MIRTLIIVAMAMLPSCASSRSQTQIEIYYVPIGVETFTATTEKNISERCQICGKRYIDTDELNKIYQMIDKADQGVFDGQRVRLKLVQPNGATLYLDNDGGIYSAGSSSRKLTKKQTKRIKELIEATSLARK
jgi:hypothetical protein